MNHPSNFIDLTGQKFNHLIVLGISGRTQKGQIIWECKCDCGCITQSVGNNLKNGRKKSCGCMTDRSFNKTHGMTRTRIYSTWLSIKKRCYNPNNKDYHNDEMNQKPDLSTSDLESLYYEVDIVKDVCEIMDDDGYSRRSSYDYDRGNSYRRGRDRETGRYVSRDESYDNMMSRLESMRSNAMDENERRMIDRWMNEAERQ